MAIEKLTCAKYRNQIMILFISFINVRLETMGYTVRDNSLLWSRGASETWSQFYQLGSLAIFIYF